MFEIKNKTMKIEQTSSVQEGTVIYLNIIAVCESNAIKLLSSVVSTWTQSKIKLVGSNYNLCSECDKPWQEPAVRAAILLMMLTPDCLRVV